jgi:16S rRNA (adenine1518-N6/adenine1519-N6)-dimethyltransferase
VLSEYLAERVGHVHVVEVDERLRAALADAVGRFENVTVHWADAMTLPFEAFVPAPSKVVANLPYGIAAAVLLRTIAELSGVSSWVAMTQREVGERLAATPGGGLYGIPSVLAQLACEVSVLRAISRSVFFPVPNVDSVLVEMRRREREPAVTPALRALVAGAFAHRRKTLAGSLALSAGAGRGGISISSTREQVRAALVELGQPPDVRAERLSPPQFRALGELLAR